MGHVKPGSEGSFDKPITAVHIDWESEGELQSGGSKICTFMKPLYFAVTLISVGR